MAIMASWLTAPHYKKAVSPKKYLEQLEPEKEKKKTTAEESKRIIEEISAELGGVQNVNDR